jgi:hypothetical protein
MPGRRCDVSPKLDVHHPVCDVRLTSTPAVRGANKWGVIQFDEEGRVIPTWEDDDDGDAA